MDLGEVIKNSKNKQGRFEIFIRQFELFILKRSLSRYTRRFCLLFKKMQRDIFQSSPVWPDVEIKKTQVFPKVVQKVASPVQLKKLRFSQLPKKSTNILATFVINLLPRNSKIHPIWSHWVFVMGGASRKFKSVLVFQVALILKRLNTEAVAANSKIAFFG